MELVGAVVGSMTTHAITVAENEAEYAGNCMAQLQHLIQSLKHIDGLLHDKERLKLNAEHVKPAMIPLRQIIYEADDVIADCILRDEYGDRFSRYNFSFLRNTGKLLKDINSRLDTQLNTLKLHLELKNALRVDAGIENSEGDDLLVLEQDFNPNVAIGIDEDIKKIKRWIVEDDKSQHYRVAVSGMGGLGKSTVVREVYIDDVVSSSYGARIWVGVSKKFNKNKILESILRKLGGTIPESSSQLLGEVRNAVVGQNGCLVVFDDVWSLDDVAWWNDLCATLEVDGQRSCVIVTTRNDEVANMVVRDGDLLHKPSILDENNSWKLFSHFSRPRSGFEVEGKKIANKCGGLPLSLKTIGSLLAGKRLLSEWTDVLKCFHDNPAIGRNEQVIERLRLSYDDLEAHLKQCLLCFSAYPEDSEISADQVIHWWLAEGLLQKPNSKRSALELGRHYLTALISRCLIDVEKRRPYDGRVYTCKVHDMVRDLLMRISGEEGFCSFNEYGTSIWNKDSYWLCLTADLVTEKETSRRRESGGSRGGKSDLTGKFLSFEKDSKLRAVLLMPGHPINLNKDSGRLSSLRMLDLSGGMVKQDPILLKNLIDWITALTRLACLNLSGFEGLDEIPSSIRELRNLQLLVLTGCLNLKRIHESVAKLKRLIVLHIDNCPRLDSLPRGVMNLYKLQELSGVKVRIGRKKVKGAIELAELGNLTELRVLHVVISSDNEADLSETTSEWTKTLSEMRNLKTLGIDAQMFRNGLHILDGIVPPENLSELYLRNYHGKKLPAWISPSKLERLEYLCIEDTESVVEWNPPDAAWGVLQGVRLKDMTKLKADWEELKRKMPALVYLEVIKCDGLVNLPKDIKDGIWRAPRHRT